MASQQWLSIRVEGTGCPESLSMSMAAKGFFFINNHKYAAFVSVSAARLTTPSPADSNASKM